MASLTPQRPLYIRWRGAFGVMHSDIEPQNLLWRSACPSPRRGEPRRLVLDRGRLDNAALYGKLRSGARLWRRCAQIENRHPHFDERMLSVLRQQAYVCLTRLPIFF